MHQMLIVGSPDLKVAEACAEVLWSKMSPDVNIQLTSALEAEITKLVENSYGALEGYIY
jgi:UDP-N-acetyl-D-mannosaminuronate dehydrogenase